ncbi:MAG: stage V sporulation protein AD [Clostridia bacterium]|nr:stage V sporulation protein AD [Clostridia bacterium]
MGKRIGSTVFFENDVGIISVAATVGKKEHDGPLGSYFEDYSDDEFFGQKTFEKAESELQRLTAEKAIKKANLTCSDIDIIFGGDLLNQCVGSTFGLRDLNIPFAGVYGACSTMALSLSLAALMIEGGFASHSAAITSSHFCSAEKQFRFPLEYGSQRTPLAQWTVTGSGCAILKKSKSAPKIKSVTFGKITDLGITDINNMGAAMAPAAADTILSYFKDSGKTANDFDLILTGDLGFVGSKLLCEIMDMEDAPIWAAHDDCGKMIFERKSQDVHSGGSGCGCSASVLCAKIIPEMQKGIYKNILFCATGALMSPITTFQGESIPAIAHLINICME